ncbi:MAG: hypothetical protein NTX66_01540 [Candidatus Falkowbacteria bacterium]|nr:hypothetical protein [Candidatus Falkowbacteria bacterium]
MDNLKNGNLFKVAALKAAGVFAYLFAVSLIINNGPKIFGEKDNKLLMPIIFLLLFVLSALTTGYLILGKPLMLYLDNEKKAGLKLLFYTGLCLAVLLFIMGLILYLIK